ELVALWARVLKDYENEVCHNDFISACHRVGCLPYASQQYARILSASPGEEVAKKMRRRIIALASYKFDARRVPAEAAIEVRSPGLNSLAMILGAVVMTAGLVLPGLEGLAGIGGALLALTIGIRIVLRRR